MFCAEFMKNFHLGCWDKLMAVYAVHELHVHHVQKVLIKRFSVQEDEMSLTAMSSHESARRKFFMNPTYILSRK